MTGGVYVNNLGEGGEDRVQAAYGENYPRFICNHPFFGCFILHVATTSCTNV
jgi:hypothetical protein